MRRSTRRVFVPLFFASGRLRRTRRRLARARARRGQSAYAGGPPDFVGIGVQRAGSTWWHQVVTAHPQVYRAPASKERHFFDRFWDVSFSDAQIESYHRLFPRPAGSVVGEWTPEYAFYFWAPPLLRLAAPEARLLVILRDPIERFRSGLSHTLTYHRGSASLAQHAFERGLYHRQLRRVLEYFDRDRLLVLQLERCREDPQREARRTYQFLGLDDTGFSPPELSMRMGRTRVPKIELHEHEIDALRSAYRDDALGLAQTFPEVDLSLWTTLAL